MSDTNALSPTNAATRAPRLTTEDAVRGTCEYDKRTSMFDDLYGRYGRLTGDYLRLHRALDQALSETAPR